MNNPWEWNKKFQDLLTATTPKPINTVGKTRYSSGIAAATSKNLAKSGGGGMFSAANAAKTAKIAGAWSMGLNLLSKLTDKSKKGQPGPTTGVNQSNLMAGLTDWTQFFS